MKIKIYTTQTCIYCNLAKKLLIEKNLNFEEVDVEKDINILKNLIKQTNHKTVPQIFIDNEFIGGYTELLNLFKK